MKDKVLLDFPFDNVPLVGPFPDIGKKFVSKVVEADKPTLNGSIYPKHVLEENVRRLQESINQRLLMGEIGPAEDSIIRFSNISHSITKMWWEDNTLMAEAITLQTPAGKLIKSLINDGVTVRLAPRGVGSRNNNVISDNYKLITLDAVDESINNKVFQDAAVLEK